VLIVGRGGGSMEDLWAFNEEVVARAIFASKIPVVSAVGHEIDYTISDFVADVRAPTPSAAAEIVVPSAEKLTERLTGLWERIRGAVRKGLDLKRQKLSTLSRSYGLRRLFDVVDRKRERLDDLVDRMERSIGDKIVHFKQTVEHLGKFLEGLSPKKVLQRGYAIVRRGDKVIKSVGELTLYDRVKIVFIDGTARAVIDRMGER